MPTMYRIQQISMSPDNNGQLDIEVSASDGTPNKWVTVPSEIKKEVLAMAISAYVTDVEILIGTAPGSNALENIMLVRSGRY